jgi:hypothetical protein
MRLPTSWLPPTTKSRGLLLVLGHHNRGGVMFIVFDSKIRILLPFLRRRGLVMVAALVSVVRGMCEWAGVGGHVCVCARKWITKCSRKAQIILWCITCGDSSNLLVSFTVVAQVNLSRGSSRYSTRQRHARRSCSEQPAWGCSRVFPPTSSQSRASYVKNSRLDALLPEQPCPIL